jgi:hypothetical protein
MPTMQLLWRVNQSFSQKPGQYDMPDMSDAEHLGQTSCGAEHLSERDVQCLDHMDIMTLGAHLTTDSRKVLVVLVVEELYVYACLHVHGTFGISHLWPQMQVLSYTQNQPDLDFKHQANMAAVLVRTCCVSFLFHQHDADESMSSCSSRCR